MIELHQYQKELAEKAAEILRAKKIVYLAMEMRVGKTLIALETAFLVNGNKQRVLFVTKKKAIESVEKDYSGCGYMFDLTVVNYEQLHKINDKYDVIIADEAHGLGAFPKPSLRAKNLKKIVGADYLILLSGTPSPESYSQLFHQFWLSIYSPFRQYTNFYKWAKDFVTVKDARIGSHVIKDYSDADQDKIMAILDGYFLRFTQQDAGFLVEKVAEFIKYIPMDSRIKRVIDILLEDKYFRFKNGAEIVCDTPAKLQSKIHQLCSGTVITETGEMRVLVTDKAEYIRTQYNNAKIAVFYKFQAEGDAIRAALPDCTDNPETFKNNASTAFVCQIAAGAMGVNLSCADVLIFYNIDFSAVLYWQARARLSDKNRTIPPIVHWLFTEGGIEDKIYKAVNKKKNYTTSYFKKDYYGRRAKNPKRDNKLADV